MLKSVQLATSRLNILQALTGWARRTELDPYLISQGPNLVHQTGVRYKVLHMPDCDVITCACASFRGQCFHSIVLLIVNLAEECQRRVDVWFL